MVFDVILAAVDLRVLPWGDRRERRELLAEAFDVPLELSPVVAPSSGLAEAMETAASRGSSLRTEPRRTATAPGRAGTRSSTRAGTSGEAWRFDR